MTLQPCLSRIPEKVQTSTETLQDTLKSLSLDTKNRVLAVRTVSGEDMAVSSSATAFSSASKSAG